MDIVLVAPWWMMRFHCVFFFPISTTWIKSMVSFWNSVWPTSLCFWHLFHGYTIVQPNWWINHHFWWWKHHVSSFVCCLTHNFCIHIIITIIIIITSIILLLLSLIHTLVLFHYYNSSSRMAPWKINHQVTIVQQYQKPFPMITSPWFLARDLEVKSMALATELLGPSDLDVQVLAPRPEFPAGVVEGRRYGASTNIVTRVV